MLKINFKALKYRFLDLAKVPISAGRRSNWVCNASWSCECSPSRRLQSIVL